jgi:RND family efflux transporter MFP subunit
MKKVLFIALTIILSACSSKVNTPETEEEIRDQISIYKKEIGELNKKIISLEEKLSAVQGDNITGIAVKVAVLEEETFNHFVEVNGSVEAINAAYISPEISGQVKEIFIREGQQVSQGQPLIKLNSTITESSIEEVKTALELANTVYEKQKQLWEKKIGSEIDFLTAKNNKEALESKLQTLRAQDDLALMRAPISGIIDEVLVKEGEFAVPGMQVIQLVNLSNLYVNADVSEAFLTKVRKGDMVRLEFPSYPDLSMQVPVYRLGNVVKTANRTFKLQLKIENPDNLIKPNVLAKIKINDYSAENALALPSLSIKQDMKGKYVYKVNGEDNSALKAYIETGLSYMDQTMVTNGLKAGDMVIVEGFNQVSDGTIVDIINE